MTEANSNNGQGLSADALQSAIIYLTHGAGKQLAESFEKSMVEQYGPEIAYQAINQVRGCLVGMKMMAQEQATAENLPPSEIPA